MRWISVCIERILMKGKAVRSASLGITETLIYNTKMAVKRVNHLYRFCKAPKKYIAGKTYFPEEKLKSTSRIFLEQLRHIIRHGEINEYYFLFGLDRQGKVANRFVPFTYSMYLKDRRNAEVPGFAFNFICLLKDKLAFSAFCRHAGVSVPQDIGVIESGKVYLMATRKNVSLVGLMQQEVDGFCKPRFGLQGKDTFALKIRHGYIFKNEEPVSLKAMQNTFAQGDWILQERIPNQHARLNEIFPHAINTIRLVTVISDQEIETLGAVLRVGVDDSRVDNWSAGGIMIPVDLENGCLTKYGFYKPEIGIKTDRHPNTKTVFENFQIPYLSEAVDTAIYLHRLMKGIHSIGWDIAITSSGPVFIEGNDQWNTVVSQLVLEGVKPQFDRLFKI